LRCAFFVCGRAGRRALRFPRSSQGNSGQVPRYNRQLLLFAYFTQVQLHIADQIGREF
jgi:hypothetical protein